MKQKFQIIIAVMSLSVLIASDAQAAGNQFRMSLNTHYMTQHVTYQTSSGSSSGETKTLYNDLLAGYVFSNSFYFGVLYGSDSVDRVSQKETWTHLGPSFGYVGDAWYFLGHYLMSGSYQLQSSSRYSDLSGSFQADLGYGFPLSGSLQLGAQMSYRKLSYQTYEVNSAKVAGTSYTLTEMIPMLALIFTF